MKELIVLIPLVLEERERIKLGKKSKITEEKDHRKARV